MVPSRQEPGCLAIGAYRSTREPRLFYIHSRWIDEAAFETHAGLPHTVRFVERMQPLIDHPFEATRGSADRLTALQPPALKGDSANICRRSSSWNGFCKVGVPL